MGEAAKRKAEELIWRRGLTPDEETLVAIAERLYPILPPGACYRAALFLQYHLRQKHGLSGYAIVGFVNDRTDDMYASHAWFTFNGQLTDLALSRPLEPRIQRPGPLVIHGYHLRRGWAWTYHQERPAEGLAVVQRYLADPMARSQMREQESVHKRMVATAKSDEMTRDYLDGAPDRLSYDRMAALVG
jgi:hypothetical protein